VLAPLLFCIFFSLMLLVAFQDCVTGVPVQFRTDRSIFNLRRLQAHTKTFAALVRDYADDGALTAHTQATHAQHLFSRFCDAAVRFGLTISLKKTEVLLQPVDHLTLTPPVVMAGETALPVVQRFCYLGSVLSSDANIDEDISSRIAMPATPLAGSWDDRGIHLDTKVAVYKAAILTSLLFGSETWVLYRRHVRKLEQFHMHCLRQIARSMARQAAQHRGAPDL